MPASTPDRETFAGYSHREAINLDCVQEVP